MKFKLLFTTAITALFSCAIFAQVSQHEGEAREWIKQHSRELNLKDEDAFKLSFVRKSLSGETLRFQQVVNDVSVYQSEIVIHFNPNNEITSTSNSYVDRDVNINTSPSISEDTAIKNADKAIEAKIIDGFSYQESKLYVYNLPTETKLVYRIITNPNSGSGSWETLVDAQTGAVISVKDVALYHSNPNLKNKEKHKPQKSSYAPLALVSGSGMVFNPDPLSQAHVAYAGNYVDNSDATNASLDAARTSIVLPEIDLTAGVYKLKSTYAEIKNISNPNKGLFTQSTNVFNFDRNQDGFEAVNAFYHIDKSLRYINEELGIPCVPTLNSGRVGFDPSALANGTVDNDNSQYVPSTQTLEFGEGGVDDAEDADVVLHELGHGIHDFLTGGNSSSLTGLGEGNGDYWAMSYSRSLNQWPTTNAAYNWVFSWDGHNEWWNGRVTNYTRTYPQTSATYTEIHEYGQIWATALMKIYDIIGKTKMDKAFLEGLSLTNSSTNQKTAAVAVRQAAIDMNYPCADIQTMTTKFNAAGYALPALTLSMASIADQTVQADATNTYTLPSYADLANPITATCNATLAQTPITGTVLTPGVYTITMVATSGTSVTKTFQLTITPFLGLSETVKNHFVLYPNPASNGLNIKGEFKSDENITIYNMLGQAVLQKELDSNENSINIAPLAKGVYNVYFNVAKVSVKFVKE